MGRYQWDWGLLFRDPYFGWLVSGLGWTLAIAALAGMIALSVGTVIGILRTVPGRVPRFIGTAYVEIFRNVPLLLQMFLWFFVLPELMPGSIGHWMKRDMPYPEFTSPVLCLGFYAASRVAEQLRSGIESISKGQARAALATGLTLPQTYRFVLLPIAFRLMVPTLTSEFLGIIKNSSLALTVGMMELTAQSRQIESFTFHGFEAFTAATVIYGVVSLIALGLARVVEGRTAIRGYMAKGGGA
ncbi:MAG: amino acid ABC transporter permease [Proteobacteria bacterium]|nr:amino acid ABC transporter permease [Pseudomonadota bacterium]